MRRRAAVSSILSLSGSHERVRPRRRLREENEPNRRVVVRGRATALATRCPPPADDMWHTINDMRYAITINLEVRRRPGGAEQVRQLAAALRGDALDRADAHPEWRAHDAEERLGRDTDRVSGASSRVASRLTAGRKRGGIGPAAAVVVVVMLVPEHRRCDATRRGAMRVMCAPRGGRTARASDRLSHGRERAIVPHGDTRRHHARAVARRRPRLRDDDCDDCDARPAGARSRTAGRTN